MGLNWMDLNPYAGNDIKYCRVTEEEKETNSITDLIIVLSKEVQ